MPTSSTSQFKYDPELLQIGTTYHYVKSNLDGGDPARVYIRVRDAKNLDVWKFESHNEDAVYVTARMDWESFSADRIQSWVVTSDGYKREQASMKSSFADSSFTASIRGQTETIQTGHYPVHVYNFDFISLNLTLRYWVAPQGEIEIGVIQPSFDTNANGTIKYEGTVLIKYLADEMRGDVMCRKYSIGGAGLQNKSGMLWLDRARMYVVDMEIPVPDNPSWNDFKFNLVSAKHMDEQAWIQFLDGEIQKMEMPEE